MEKKWSNLARIVTRRTYSRQDNGTLETWGDTVRRAVEGNVRGRNVPEQEVARLIQLAEQRKSGFAGRGWWFSGTDAHKRIGGAALNNCFSGETKFLTKCGMTSLSDSVGKEVEVLSSIGQWKRATVESFGKQKLKEVSFRPYKNRSDLRRKYYVTADHRWITDNRGQVTDLKVGDSVTISPVRLEVEQPQYESGYCHGLIFADGTQQSQNTYRIRLCGHKAVELAVLQRNSTFRHVGTLDNDPMVCIRSSYDLKSLPEMTNYSYVMGFIDAWIKMDGSRSKGTLRLFSINKEALEWLMSVGPMFGYVATGLKNNHNDITNYGDRTAPLWTLSLSTKPRKQVVERITPTEREEEVYCVVEPSTKSFTLEGGIPTGNCWVLVADCWENFVIAQDLLMLGGGVGMSVEHKYVSKLPKVKKDVVIVHKNTKDSDFIVPDSREGWNELTRRVLESFFVTGRSFSYSTICLRGHGESIKGFGGVASGPLPLITFVETLCSILVPRASRAVRTIDAADILTATGQMVVSGNVRRSALLLQGDPWDKEYLKAKRWDLGTIPSHRANANYSVVCSDIDDLHPLFWRTYEQGEPFGIINLDNARTFGRMGEIKSDNCQGFNPCAEAQLENGEPCNLVEQALSNFNDEDEFVESSRLWFRAAKRVTLEHYHHTVSNEVIKRNRRVGVGITGCLASPLFNPKSLDRAYKAIQQEDEVYSKELGVPKSIRTTVIKPSGTMSKVFDCGGYEGIHPAYSRYIIQRVRFSSGDTLIPKLKAAGHHIEPVLRFDGTVDHGTLVVDFYVEAPKGGPVADEDWDTWKQLDAVLMAQKYWADQSVSCTVYYKREDIPKLKQWLADNLKNLKTISFLCHDEHGFKQAPKEAITKQQFEKLSSKILDLGEDDINGGDLESMECEGGACPIK